VPGSGVLRARVREAQHDELGARGSPARPRVSSK
jgi:hypothetical protein